MLTKGKNDNGIANNENAKVERIIVIADNVVENNVEMEHEVQVNNDDENDKADIIIVVADNIFENNVEMENENKVDEVTNYVESSVLESGDTSIQLEM